MTLAATPSTAKKRAIVEMAYEECSLAGYEFNVTPDELITGLRRLDALMAEWATQSLDVFYNFPSVLGEGDLDDVAGVPDSTINIIAMALARRIAPMMGKTISAESRAAFMAGMNGLRTACATIPVAVPRYGTVRGAGNRLFYSFSPFLSQS